MTEVPGAIVPILRASMWASFTGVPSIVVMTSRPRYRPWRPGCRSAARHHRALRLLEAEAVGDVGGDGLDLDADPAAGHVAVILELGDDHLGGVGRNVEADADRAARRREDRGVDPDHVAADVEGRAAGIALVHRGVDLDEVVIRTRADVAAARRDDAGRHGAAEAERIADRDHPVADARITIRELDEREVVALDLDQREVGLGVGADDLGVSGSARRRS